jgi:hypothetical protein
MPPHVPLADRFWTKVDKSGDCWMWTAHRNRDGYGLVGLDFRGVDRSHRVAWRLTYGDIPPGMQVLHRCDTPGCVRPDHLWLGTHLDNMADRQRKHRTRTPFVGPGSAAPNAKLRDEDIPVIRAYVAIGVGDTAIARMYGVSRVTINHVRTGKSWSHL